MRDIFLESHETTRLFLGIKIVYSMKKWITWKCIYVGFGNMAFHFHVGDNGIYKRFWWFRPRSLCVGKWTIPLGFNA